ncbi:receptor-type tyrosine-protein phosphatase T-like isoform X2 [Saccostrea cucullata]|uniref:receptor-type tyrosine-protein phosphatase T-like isoform X2 n=1 Tax=Saccostrea cuccullata TaxID=36930 RepID=UPI002ED35588
MSGFYGFFCKIECSENCRQDSCSRSGTCIDGCKLNWTGDKCNKCDLIHHGTDCLQVCSVNCINQTCDDDTGVCTLGCNEGYYSHKCEQSCSALCPSGCSRYSGECKGNCPVGKYGNQCEMACNQNCKNICSKVNGSCTFGCIDGKFGVDCLQTCGGGCISGCNQADGRCYCEKGWQGENCDGCESTYYGQECEYQCSSNCLNKTCLSNNGSCIGGCKGDFIDEKCSIALAVSDTTSLPTTAIGAGFGAALFLLVFIIIVVIVLRYRRQMRQNSKSEMVIYKKDHVPPSAENKLYTNIGSVFVAIEDPEEEPQIENPEEAVYYNDLSVAKDIAVSDLLTIITQKEARENEGFQKEFKSLPYGERFACETAKTEENMLRNRFKTTFPYDHSRIILEVSKGFASDYINANYIENMEGRREFIACQGPRENTLIDHWRMIWQEHVEYIVMLTNLIEGPKVKCHQYWPDEGKELDINPFSVTMLEETVYAYFVERKMNVRKKRITGSRTVVQYHYTRWPDHGTPNPLNLVVFHRHFRHKIKSTQSPIIVHCSAGIGRTGTFIALDVLSRYGKDKGKVNIIEYVKAMRKDRMTMIQNVDQYAFLYHALYEFFRRKGQYRKKDEFRGLYGDTYRINSQKQLTNELNELVNVKPSYDARDFKSGKEFSGLNFTKSVLPVEQYLVYLTSHVSGRESYYNAVHVSSFTRAEEFISAQFPVSGAAIDLARLLVDQESTFLISMNPLSEIKELQNWVEGKAGNVKLNPYTIVREEQKTLSDEMRKTNIKITKKGIIL